MVGVYGYCVVPAGHAPAAGLSGLAAEAIELIDIGTAGLWVGRMNRPEPGVAGVKAHNRVVEAAITEHITPVPLRFGQWLEDEQVWRAAVSEKAAWYAERLAEFAGALEFGLRIIDPALPPEARDVRIASSTSGREYMQALRESSRLAEQKRGQAETVRSRIQELMTSLVRAEREEDARTPHAVLTVMHLVARPDFDEYRQRAQELRQLFPALRWLLSGPWAPYSFVT